MVTIGPEKQSSGIGKPEEGAHRQDEFRRPSAGCTGYADKLVGEDRDEMISEYVAVRQASGDSRPMQEIAVEYKRKSGLKIEILGILN